MKKTAKVRHRPVVGGARSVGRGTRGEAGTTAEIRAVMERCTRSWKAGGLGAVMAAYAPDAVLITEGQRPLLGSAAIREFLHGQLHGETPALRQDITHVHAVGDTAWDEAVYLRQLPQPRGQQRGRRVTLWKRARRKWRISGDVWFSEPTRQPPAAGQPLLPAMQPLTVEARVARLQNALDQLARLVGMPRGVQRGPFEAAPSLRVQVFAHTSRFITVPATAVAGFDYPTTPAGQTPNFNVLYDPSLGARGALIANGVLATCEQDYATLRSYFGGVSPPDLPFNVIIAAGIAGAYHRGCTAVDIYCDADTSPDPDLDLTRMLLVGEVTEVLSATLGSGWDCGSSNGEGLSRVLAVDTYPGSLDGFATAAAWLDSANRPDWVSSTEPTDIDPVANGCSVLFLNYLHSQLGFTWNAIVQAGAPTLAQTYTLLTGSNNGFEAFSALLASAYPPSVASGLTTDNPFPIG